jgi:hypothetical protein
MARPEGLEPPTSGLEIRCSIHLSYGRAGYRTGGPDVGLGWVMGLEPMTPGTTIQCSTN